VKKKHNLTNQRFGRLTALYVVPSNTYRTRWRCLCDCGNTKDVLQQSLLNGHVQSCGCLLSDRNRERITEYNKTLGKETHGETKTRLYRIWICMKTRCFYKNNDSYKNYGGRGITVCNDWRNSFETFRLWALSNGYSDKLSLDRINVDKNYCPENCRWVSMSVQEFNKRTLKRNTSGKTGVSFNKKNNRWVAYISFNKQHYHLGSFKCVDDAIKAREKAEEKLNQTDFVVM
jgi:hypothetical protein